VTKDRFLPLNVLFLAAGFGTRLGKTGEKTAKGLFRNANGQTITDLLIKDLWQFPFIKDYALVTNQRFYQQYQDHFNQNYPNLKIKIINDGANSPKNRLGAIADLILALDVLNWWNKNVLVLPSDRNPGSILAKLIQFAQKHPLAFNTVLRITDKSEIKNKRGCAVINEQNEITDFVEKPANPPSNLASVPFYIFPKKSLALVKKYKNSGGNMDAPGNLIPWLLENNFPVYAYVTKEEALDIGTLEELAEFQKN
jgi:glucose-1-phosphate thymidylyltransferase